MRTRSLEPDLGRVAYARCSTDRQDLSPDAQRAAIQARAGREGVTIVAEHEDRDISGGRPSRG